ncbi:MAG: hypothetical protein HZB99_02395 [Candidatus Harrisonbacteria bacterium]|nr:hypothetical protein [Candidatus Harrisonbacteria bacterium]
MKSILAILLIVVLAAIAIFGFSTMAHGHGCVAEMLQGKICTSNNPFAVVGFHMQAFHTFTRAVAGWASIFLTALAFILLGLAFTASLVSPHSDSFWRLGAAVVLGSINQPLLSWIALHENSPALVSGA